MKAGHLPGDVLETLWVVTASFFRCFPKLSEVFQPLLFSRNNIAVIYRFYVQVFWPMVRFSTRKPQPNHQRTKPTDAKRMPSLLAADTHHGRQRPPLCLKIVPQVQKCFDQNFW